MSSKSLQGRFSSQAIRGPSVATMVKDLRITKKEAEAVKAAMKSGDVYKVLNIANKAMGTFGVEAFSHETFWINSYWQNCSLLFLNAGDSYNTTLCYDTDKNQFLITTWGDWVEGNKAIQRFERKRGVW